ncbi:DsbA family protein [Flavobacterium sp. 7A]|uniref:DsbA family protein n=1 Tax=Flavobacterium sp. 7A TaxID=2940571 RepID=UPI0022269CCB|nr:DsbA family protein [Flavobacterium sp. 7A]MCW2118641.1 2-polyprenyl-6-methoxyphenol hydroxylase-like FAD-dependent oxidoreductase/predicted DsbA family dithiol-disulfide isomerase [Flavobacterium sp. 7A]
MKAVILGGGIAGMTMALLLRKENWQVIINERAASMLNQGHAFLMSADGLSILAEFSKEQTCTLHKQNVNLFSLKRPNGDEEIRIKLDGWHCMKRVELISYLYSFFTNETLKMGRVFSHFLYENNKASAAVFENGEIEYGDLFIGADGSNSKVREALFGKVTFTPVEVNEIVGISKKRAIDDPEKVVFQKYQSKIKGLAFGFIPASCDESVWFMQYDVKLATGHEGQSPEALKEFCYKMLEEFPDEVRAVLDVNDFATSYIWKTRDFNTLPTFHKDNVVLIGDAAHLALPFTSAGTTNALLDAQTLTSTLMTSATLESAFERFYQERSADLTNHLEQGRLLKKTFLEPEKHSERGYILPLVTDKDKNETTDRKPLKITYFTDPICSTCWVIQPVLRKLKLEYGNYLNFEYLMGGLLPSWDNYTRGRIKNATDVAKHWEEVSKEHNTPLDGDIWIDDPLDSSYPPSIAFKAAQLQSNDKAISFLRRMQEMIFIEKKNISKWPEIEKAALTCGLDSALLFKDLKVKGLGLFQEDLDYAKELNITSFPTILFSIDNEIKTTLAGLHPYEKFEEILRQYLPDLSKSTIKITPESMFQLFNNMTESEYAFITNQTVEESQQILSNLFKKGVIKKYDSKNGSFWTYIEPSKRKKSSVW